MDERRRSRRKQISITVGKRLDNKHVFCQTSDISPTGIRLRKICQTISPDGLVSIEIPLVPGGLLTAINARRIWWNTEHEGFEFVGPTFAQQVMLERLLKNF